MNGELLLMANVQNSASNDDGENDDEDDDDEDEGDHEIVFFLINCTGVDISCLRNTGRQRPCK